MKDNLDALMVAINKQVNGELSQAEYKKVIRDSKEATKAMKIKMAALKQSKKSGS